MAILAVRREHVSIVIFKEHMPKKMSAALTMLAQIITVVICLIVIYVGIQYVLAAGHRPTPYGYAYAAIPVSFVFVTIFELRNLIVDLTGKGNYAVIEKKEEDLTGGSDMKMD